MPMEVLTILQWAGCLAAYLVMTFLLPAVLLYRKIRRLRFCERFITYQMVGNFYMMNLVFLLELLHISNRATLFLFTVIPCVGIYTYLYKKNPVRAVRAGFDRLERIAGGQFGIRLFLRRVRAVVWKQMKRAVKGLFVRIGRNLPDILLFATLTAGLCYMYGTNLLRHYGYCESDLPVHNYWINYLGKNQIFVAGIYPFGFHCVMYFLHEIFSIPTYVLLRVFCFAQNLMIHYMLLAFAKYCCKSKFAPYIGMFLYVFLGIFGENTYIRYFSTLPQEFGMLFILPPIYYLFAFFKKRKELDKAEKEQKTDGEQETASAVVESEKEKTKTSNDRDWDLDGDAKAELPEEGLAAAGVEPKKAKTKTADDWDWDVDDDAEMEWPEEGLAVAGIEAELSEEGLAAAGIESEKPELAAEGRRGIRARLLRWITKRKEKRAGKERKPKTEDFWYLAGFAISFGMSLSAHFYDTMIAGLLCVGVAVGYGFRLFRPKYFRKVMLAGIASLAISIFPMFVAFLMGTPLQGSLGWGMNVISGKGNKDTVQTTEQAQPVGTVQQQAGGTAQGQDMQGMGGTAGISGGDLGNVQQGGQIAPVKKEPLMERLTAKARSAFDAFWNAMEIYIISDSYPVFQMALVGAIAFLAAISLLFFLIRQADYGARCLSLSAGLFVLAILQASSRLGLPTLMDAIRTCIFFAYVLAAAWSLCVDAVLQLFLGWAQWRWLRWVKNVLSLAALAAVVCYADQEGLIRNPPDRQPLQTNDAIMCLTNIIHDNENFTWTICSANDELRMGEDFGYHHEVHTFLKDVEKLGDTVITIPTAKVYFFIEKVPIVYARAYRGDEPEVSDEAAAEPLPGGSGITMYQGHNRLIEMSKLYRWAQAFQKLYPDDMKVYYESGNFVCYCVEQDLYRPFNFALQ